MKRKASAIWQGALKEGKGTISTESGVLSRVQYSFSTRFESGIGTNPRGTDRGGSRSLFLDGAFCGVGKIGPDS